MAILLGPDLVPKSSGNVIRIRNVLDGAVDDVGLGHFHQVADTASDEALEDEDVTLDIQTGVVRVLRPRFNGLMRSAQGRPLSGWLLPGSPIILKLDEQKARIYDRCRPCRNRRK